MSSDQSQIPAQGEGLDPHYDRPEELANLRIEFEAKLLAQEHRLLPILRNFSKYRRLRKDKKLPVDDPRPTGARDALLWRIVVALLPSAAAAGVSITAFAGVYLAYKTTKLFTEQNIRIQTQNLLLEGQRRSTLVFELSRVLDLIHEHISDLEPSVRTVPHWTKPHAAMTLPDHINGRLLALSRRLEPYYFIDPETGKLIDKPLSPERGQLLVALVGSNLWIPGIDLSRADLRGAILRGGELSGANLKGADLRGADLRRALTDRITFLEPVQLDGAKVGYPDWIQRQVFPYGLKDWEVAPEKYNDDETGWPYYLLRRKQSSP